MIQTQFGKGFSCKEADFSVKVIGAGNTTCRWSWVPDSFPNKRKRGDRQMSSGGLDRPLFRKREKEGFLRI